jgi:hypothetical protein
MNGHVLVSIADARLQRRIVTLVIVTLVIVTLVIVTLVIVTLVIKID